MFPQGSLRSRLLLICLVVLAGSIALVAFGYSVVVPTAQNIPTPTPTAVPTATPQAPLVTSSPTASSLPLEPILGVEGDLQTFYPGIPWVRFGYPTCGVYHLSGTPLRHAIQAYHNLGIRVLLTTCQQSTGPSLFDPAPLNDVALTGADAVQCGNEQMKNDPPNTRYIPPQDFARYFDLCASAVHAVRPDTPVLLGSLDPHVGGVDYQPLLDQVHYLDTMQHVMNTTVHPGGNWSWRAETLGLIDSWHNGYPNQYVNSLRGLFVFWAQQFHVDLNSGALGKHIWVVEGTSCYKGCGLDEHSKEQLAISHILTLIIDVQTTLRYKIPFFYFSGKDIPNRDGTIGPTGVFDVNGHPKPLRQDLPMGARSLRSSCPSGQVVVVEQEQLLAKLYNGCILSTNYATTLLG